MKVDRVMLLVYSLMIPITVFGETPPVIQTTVRTSTNNTASDATEEDSMGMDRMRTHFDCGLPIFADTSCWAEERLIWRQPSVKVAN